MFLFLNNYWGFSAIDAIVNDAIVQLTVATPEKRLRILIPGGCISSFE